MEGNTIRIWDIPEWARERLRTEIVTYTHFKNVEFLEEKGGGDEDYNQSS